MMDNNELQFAFLLLVVFQVKQFVADFPLQREYMLKKVSPNWDFVLPLTMHCAVHATLTLMITLLVNPTLWWLALADFVIHFVMDRIKSGPRYLGRFTDRSRPGYWNTFGFDQMVHHLTHIWIVWVLITS
ncbi:MAG: DUF3307 domain-containing protein [Bdellovibrionaceae bacterium]|nr:DUF3307 domain-containing protein [Pseudobdellovibrionaceae bacterium]